MLLKSLGALTVMSILVATAGAIWAAVPVSQIRLWQSSAPEAVDVTVLAIQRSSATHPIGNGGSATTTDVTLTANVDFVRRTVSGLAPGSVIVVRYSIVRQLPPMPGIQQDIIPNVGERAVVYLKQTSEKTYILACAFGCVENL
jgi:hypothetical protein